MKTALLILAVALSGFVQAAPSDHKLGKCHEWLLEIERHNEQKEHEKHDDHDEKHDDHDEKHDYKHEMIPDCDKEGNFIPKQCHVFTKDDEWCQPNGECYEFKEGQKWCACVDRITGMPDKSSIQQGDAGMHCDGEVHPPCPEGFTYHREHDYGQCYMFVDKPKTWVEAESHCQFLGKGLWGHLASIHCEDTSHFIQKLTLETDHDFEESWAGAHNLLAPTFWMWSDGMSFDYQEFITESAEFHPNSCLRINLGLRREWGSINCSATLPYICQSETLDWLEHGHY